MTANDDSCSSYDSISATDLTVGTTHTVSDADADADIDIDTDTAADKLHVYYFGFYNNISNIRFDSGSTLLLLFYKFIHQYTILIRRLLLLITVLQYTSSYLYFDCWWHWCWCWCWWWNIPCPLLMFLLQQSLLWCWYCFHIEVFRVTIP